MTMRVTTMVFVVPGLRPIKVGGQDESEMHREVAMDQMRRCGVCLLPIPLPVNPTRHSGRMYCSELCQRLAQQRFIHRLDPFTEEEFSQPNL